jgi:hypothetical protein
MGGDCLAGGLRRGGAGVGSPVWANGLVPWPARNGPMVRPRRDPSRRRRLKSHRPVRIVPGSFYDSRVHTGWLVFHRPEFSRFRGLTETTARRGRAHPASRTTTAADTTTAAGWLGNLGVAGATISRPSHMTAR